MPHEQHVDALRPRGVDDAVEVVVRLRRRQSAQRVVAAERDDEDAYAGFERLIDAPQAPGASCPR